MRAIHSFRDLLPLTRPGRGADTGRATTAARLTADDDTPEVRWLREGQVRAVMETEHGGSAGLAVELRILLIEPDDDTRGLLELALSARGHVVTIGTSAEDAVRAVAAEPFPMIVLDQHLPDLAVTELCPRIRAEQHGEASTIVVLVEQADTAERDDILAAGADDCLVWPIDAMALRTHLETLEASAAASGPTVLASIVASVGEQGEAAIVLGRDGTVRDATTELSDWLERPTDALLGESAFTLLHVDDAPELLSLSTQALETTEITGSVFVRFQSIDGGWRRLHLRALNRFDDPQVDGIVLLASQAEVEVVAPTLPDNPLRDEATGLASAALFMDRLEHALLLAERRQEPVMAMVIGLNGLDDQDRVDGAADLDSVAMQVAECMRERLRRGDTAARIRPREFGALCEDIRDADDALDLVRNLIGALQEPLAVEDAKRNITPCIGAVLSWNGHGTASEVLDEARIAHRVAAGHAQTDGHFALHELGQRPEGDPQVIVVDERPAPMLVLDPADADEIWYTPLMDRIGRLENEIGRLNERRASTRLAQTL